MGLSADSGATSLRGARHFGQTRIVQLLQDLYKDDPNDVEKEQEKEKPASSSSSSSSSSTKPSTLIREFERGNMALEEPWTNNTQRSAVVSKFVPANSKLHLTPSCTLKLQLCYSRCYNPSPFSHITPISVLILTPKESERVSDLTQNHVTDRLIAILVSSWYF